MAQTSVDDLIANTSRWRNEMVLLDELCRRADLVPTVKWSSPCYTLAGGGNVAMVSAHVKYCTLSFFKGALLSDPDQLLQKPGPNTQSARVIYFTDEVTIRSNSATLLAYLNEARELEVDGATVRFTSVDEVPVPKEWAVRAAEEPELSLAFAALTPGRRKAYLLHFAAAKQPTTRYNRIERWRARILAGYGMQDCTCGLSKKLPGCDGSHRALPKGEWLR